MKIYHGSTVIVKEPKIIQSDNFLDFGRGFYTTTTLEQAVRWAKIKMKRVKMDLGFVSVYEFDFDMAKTQTDIFRFETADKGWLKFVVSNRKGKEICKAEDIQIGPIADDNVYKTVTLFEQGVYDTKETIKRLKTEILKEQWVFRSDKALKFLKFIEAREINNE